MAKFLEVFEDVTKYGTKIPTDKYLASGEYPIIDQGQTYISGYINDGTGLFTDVPAIIFGDHTRVLKYVDTPCFLGADGVKLLKTKDNSSDYKYLYYALCNANIPNTGYNRHFKWLKEVNIPLPNVETQHQIANTLDKVTHTIDICNAILEKLDLLVKSRFIEMFGDPVSNSMNWNTDVLSKHMNVLGGYAFKSDLFKETGIPVLRIGNINSGCFRPVNMVFWQEDKQLDRYKMYAGDLVMSLTGTVGKDDYGNVCILGTDYDVYYLNQRNAKLELFPSLDKYYISELLKFEEIKKRLTGISRGVRQANISNKDILNLCVPIPPIDLQTQFAAFVAQTDKSKFEVQQIKEKAETLKKALMQEYFG